MNDSGPARQVGSTGNSCDCHLGCLARFPASCCLRRWGPRRQDSSHHGHGHACFSAADSRRHVVSHSQEGYSLWPDPRSSHFIAVFPRGSPGSTSAITELVGGFRLESSKNPRVRRKVGVPASAGFLLTSFPLRSRAEGPSSWPGYSRRRGRPG